MEELSTNAKEDVKEEDKREPEVWKKIDLRNVKKNTYFVSSYGRVRNSGGKILSTYLDKDGYVKCTLYDEDGNRHHFLNHRLVAIMFIPIPKHYFEEGYTLQTLQVNHLKPDDKKDLYYKNLEWCTNVENIKHSVDNKLQEPITCEDHGRATLTNAQVHKICKMMQDFHSNKSICLAFGYKKDTEEHRKAYDKFRGILKHIRNRHTWVLISSQYTF